MQPYDLDRFDGLPVAQTRMTVAVLICAALGLAAWFHFARLTTTLEVSGRIAAQTLSAEVQSSQSGRIVEVFVHDFDLVDLGDPLALIDPSALSASLRSAVAERQNLRLEYDLTTYEVLPNTQPVAYDRNSPAAIAFLRNRDDHELRLRLLAMDESMSEAKAQRFEAEAAIFKDRVTVTQTRLDALVALNATGYSSDEAVATKRTDLLEYRQEFERAQSQSAEASEAAKRAKLQFDQLKTERAALLATRRYEIEQRLSELNARIADLEAQIGEAWIRAPRAGRLSGWQTNENTVVSAGSVLGQITGRLDAVRIALTIPVDLVDQVFVGQKGIATFSTLPQRAVPRLTVQVTSRAEKSEQDENAEVRVFTGVAEFEAGELDRLKSALGDEYKLALDIPLTVVLEGRTTTLSSYFLGPLQSAFRKAFQD
ncbi:MAG: biotin/lipoyl-binding protein [Pseudomonadota bacterium]